MKIDGYPVILKEKVVSLIKDGDTIAFSGFTAAGAAKAVPVMLAEHARQEHAQGRSFRIRVLTGASSGNYIDNDLAEANAISWRAPYQGGKVRSTARKWSMWTCICPMWHRPWGQGFLAV